MSARSYPRCAGPSRTQAGGRSLGSCLDVRRGESSVGIQNLERDRRVRRRHGHRVVRLLHLRDAGHHGGAEDVPAGERDGPAAAVPVDLRRRLRRASLRSALLRPDRRPGRAQVRLPRHAAHHGRCTAGRRPAPRLRDDRLCRTGPIDLVPDPPGPRPRRRVRRGGHLRGRARPRQQAGLLHELHPDHGHPRPVHRHLRGHRLSRSGWARKTSPTGAGGSRSWRRSSWSGSRSTSGSR